MVDEGSVAQTRTHIKRELCRLKGKLENGQDDELIVWVIPGVLACAHRPLRYHPIFGGSGRKLPPDAAPEVLKWVGRIANEGIRSIICLMHPKEIQHYAALDFGARDIIALYQEYDFTVCHLPWDDPNHRSPEGPDLFRDELLRNRSEALACFDRLPKPTLVHCSAGQDRSAPVAAFIHQLRRTADTAA